MTEIHSVGPFILGKSLGAGATGRVKLGFHKETGFKVAVKIINKEFLASRPSMRKKVEKEIVVMKIVDHPNVLKLYDVYETSKYLFLILEYVEGGELFDYLVSRGSLEPAEALHFFQQIIRGLDYCHSNIICHRDLKPENLLFVENEKGIKIADFGMASLMRRNTLLQTSCGSPHYASPEVVTGTKYNGMGADIWSCGVILYALLSGKLPFDDENIRRLLAKVRSGVFSMPAFLPKDAQDLIQKMLTVDVTKRITMQGIKDHPWYLSNSPSPLYTLQLPLIEDASADPLEDQSVIDDEILRSLKALGLGTEVDIQLALTNRRASVITVFYNLLKNRKDTQDVNTLYPSHNNLTRGRSNTTTTLPPASPEMGKNRSRSLLSSAEQPRRGTRGSLGTPLPPSPLAGPQRGDPYAAYPQQAQPVNGHYHNVQTRGRSNSLSSNHAGYTSVSQTGSGSSGDLMFPIIDVTGSGSSDTMSPMSVHANGSANNLSMDFTMSPQATPPGSPKVGTRRRQGSISSPHNPLTSSGVPPHLQLDPSTASPSVPVSISDKFRRIRLDNSVASSPPGSPIIGSNPKRSWFSNFFSGSPQTSPRGETTFTMQTHKDGVELSAEIQRVLSSLKDSSWRMVSDDVYHAEHKTGDGTRLKFIMEVMNGKTKQNVEIRVIVVTLKDGPVLYFNFLCAQIHNEMNL